MTIDEAIKDLKIMKHIGRNLFPPEEQEALQLGIEALKRCKYIRTHPSEPRVWKLKGETEK